MVKLVFCIRKRPDMTDAEFHEYWRERHGSRIRGIAERLLATRYIQSHRIETALDGPLAESRGIHSEPFDGVTEIWWETMDDLLASVGTPEGQALARDYIADEANFVDFSRSSIFLAEEHTVFDFSDRKGLAVA